METMLVTSTRSPPMSAARLPHELSAATTWIFAEPPLLLLDLLVHAATAAKTATTRKSLRTDPNLNEIRSHYKWNETDSRLRWG